MAGTNAESSKGADAESSRDAESSKGHSPEHPRRRDLIGGATIGVIAAVLSSVASALILIVAAPALESRLREPTCDDPRSLSLVTGVTASSSTDSLPPEKGQTFDVENLVDGDSGTAWAEPVRDPRNPYETGTELRFSLPERSDVRLICVVNGYGRSWPAYELNARLRLVDVTTDAGDEEEVGLPEKSSTNFSAYQALRAPDGETDYVIIEIVAVRAGQGAARASDTAVSEVEIWESD